MVVSIYKLRKRVKITFKAFGLFFPVSKFELFCNCTTWTISWNMYTVQLFKVKKFRVNILDEADDISLCSISDVLSIHLQDLVIGEELLVRRSVCNSSCRTQNQQGLVNVCSTWIFSKNQVQLQMSMIHINSFRAYTSVFSRYKLFAQKIQSNDLQESQIQKKWGTCNLLGWLHNAQLIKSNDRHYMHLFMELANCVESFNS